MKVLETVRSRIVFIPFHSQLQRREAAHLTSSAYLLRGAPRATLPGPHKDSQQGSAPAVLDFVPLPATLRPLDSAERPLLKITQHRPYIRCVAPKNALLQKTLGSLRR